jgi:hypothetical protein
VLPLLPESADDRPGAEPGSNSSLEIRGAGENRSAGCDGPRRRGRAAVSLGRSGPRRRGLPRSPSRRNVWLFAAQQLLDPRRERRRKGTGWQREADRLGQGSELGRAARSRRRPAASRSARSASAASSFIRSAPKTR